MTIRAAISLSSVGNPLKVAVTGIKPAAYNLAKPRIPFGETHTIWRNSYNLAKHQRGVKIGGCEPLKATCASGFTPSALQKPYPKNTKKAENPCISRIFSLLPIKNHLIGLYQILSDEVVYLAGFEPTAFRVGVVLRAFSLLPQGVEYCCSI